jgi:Tol biopolymer transport system component
VVINTTNGAVIGNTNFPLEGGGAVEFTVSANGAAAIDDSVDDGSGVSKVFVVNPATGGLNVISPLPSYEIDEAVLSPDGSRVVTTQYTYTAASQTYTTQIWVTNVATNVTTSTIVVGAGRATARWSSDGLRVTVETTTGMRTLAV